MRAQMLFLSLLLAILPACPQSARAAMVLQPLDDIRAAAISALGAEGDTSVATVAANLRLASCTQPLLAVASGAHTALVRCPDTPGWRLYVPVRTHREADVVVLRTPSQPISWWCSDATLPMPPASPLPIRRQRWVVVRHVRCLRALR